MKRTLLTTALLLTVVINMMAMSESKIRLNARFIADRMAHELDLTPMQYDDCYEINYDFISAINPIMDDVVYGYHDAVSRYYDYLDYRNEDLRYVLTNRQYVKFMSSEYFYRPVYTTRGTWSFRIYTIYSNASFFYFDMPTGYRTYAGAHRRSYYSNGFYSTRGHYSANDRYMGNVRIRGGEHFESHRRNDFGANIRQRNQPNYNNYSNRNDRNRTQNDRYRDDSGNHNSPAINNRPVSAPNRRGNGQEAGRVVVGRR